MYGLEQGIGKPTDDGQVRVLALRVTRIFLAARTEVEPQVMSRRLDCEAGTAQRESAWLRLGPVPAKARKPLQDRFDKAVRRVLESRRRPVARA